MRSRAVGTGWGLLACLFVCPALDLASVPAHGGQGPSFSCERAGLLDEQIICSDALLRIADSVLARQFAGLIRETDDPVRREAIRADEHGWILRRNRECGATAGVRLLDAERPLLVDCFLAAYDERGSDLDRIRREPGTEPGRISAPIRHPSFAPSTAAPETAIDTGLIAGDADQPVMAWRPDGSLLVIGRLASGGGSGLFQWRPGAKPVLLSDAVADPDRVERICLTGEDILLVPKGAGDPAPVQLLDGKSIRLLSRHDVPPVLAQACGLWSRRHLILDAAGEGAVSLGSIDRQAGEPGDRFVMLRHGADTHPVTPPIRVDRRTGMRGQYLAQSAEFVVSLAHRPSPGEAGFERVWAKTGCLSFWRIAAADGAETVGCIPFGDYVGLMPQPLPTAGGLYFAAESAGLYRIDGSTAARVLSGPVDDPLVAPDGCQIAFARGSPSGRTNRRGQKIAVFDACHASGP